MNFENLDLNARAASCGFKWRKSPSGEFSELCLLDHSVVELAEDFMLPLVLLNANESEETAARLKGWTQRLQDAIHGSPGAIWLGSAAAQEFIGQSPSLYASVHGYPRQLAVKFLEAIQVGTLVQSPGELERVRRTGSDLKSTILSSPFKTCQESLNAHSLGVGVVEIDNFPEAFELLSIFRRSDIDSGEGAITWSRPETDQTLRLCLRVSLDDEDRDEGGLNGAEVQSIFAQCRVLEGVSIVGVSLSWRSAVDVSLTQLKKSLAVVRELALVCHAQASPLRFVLVGPRSRLDPFSPVSERVLQLLCEGLGNELRGLPLRIILSCGDAIFRYSGHLVTSVVRKVLDGFCEKIYLDCALPAGVGPVADVLPVTVKLERLNRMRGSTRTDLKASRSPSQTTTQRFFVRDGNNHRPRTIFESASLPNLVEGDMVVLPRVGVSVGVELNRCCTLSKPTEILVSSRSEPSVVRARVFDTGQWSEEGG